jgi:hypothetical protein
METRSMSSRAGQGTFDGALHKSYRQDAREGGEIPPLPRNCERPCPSDRRFGQWKCVGCQPGIQREVR